MEIIHDVGILKIWKNIGADAGFLLTNKNGSYCSFFSNPSSRYFGLFWLDEKSMSMYKFIENIEVIGSNKVLSLKNNFYSAERRKENAVELFLMPRNCNSMIYELDSEKEINIFMDCKGSYDNREWGRNYEILDEGGVVVVKFTKKTDKREDASDGEKEFELYMAVKSSRTGFRKNNSWVERKYDFDEQRNSHPNTRHVFNALGLKGSKFVFSMSNSKAKAIEECNRIFNNMHELKTSEMENFLKIMKNESIRKLISDKKINDELKMAYLNAINSLSSLSFYINGNFGIFAGLPWFFQLWSRDILVSLKAFSSIDSEFTKKLLIESLEKIMDDGRLPNQFGIHDMYSISNADSHGWLFLRCRELIDKIEKSKEAVNFIKKSITSLKNADSARIQEYMKKCRALIKKKENEYHQLAYEIESSLEKSFYGLLKKHTSESLEINAPKETWMDTNYGNDTRSGARIEIQAFRLNLYKMLFELTQNQKYKILENTLKIKVKQKFWNGKTLADGLGTLDIRPNIFLASYAYPQLLSNSEWETCFENALKSLWLDWGGLSTIDKNNPLFCDASTGEDRKSYHRGDSWFWINNLAAIQLNKINKKKFEKYVQKIIQASTQEILWKGCVGCHAELSSAKELRSEGCLNQAWSNAMFVELIDELFL